MTWGNSIREKGSVEKTLKDQTKKQSKESRPKKQEAVDLGRPRASAESISTDRRRKGGLLTGTRDGIAAEDLSRALSLRARRGTLRGVDHLQKLAEQVKGNDLLCPL